MRACAAARRSISAAPSPAPAPSPTRRTGASIRSRWPMRSVRRMAWRRARSIRSTPNIRRRSRRGRSCRCGSPTAWGRRSRAGWVKAMGDLLFLAHRVPYPPDRGDKIRSYNILKHLAARHRVHLAAFADDEADEAAAEHLRPLVAKLHVERRTRSRGAAAALAMMTRSAASVTAFASKGMSGFVDRVLADEPIDRVYVFSGQMAQYAPADRPFVMDFVDMDSEKFAAYGRDARGPMRWMWQREAHRLFHFERETARRAVVSLFVSEAE